jgi:hypothetical protein
VSLCLCGAPGLFFRRKGVDYHKGTEAQRGRNATGPSPFGAGEWQAGSSPYVGLNADWRSSRRALRRRLREVAAFASKGGPAFLRRETFGRSVPACRACFVECLVTFRLDALLRWPACARERWEHERRRIGLGRSLKVRGDLRANMTPRNHCGRPHAAEKTAQLQSTRNRPGTSNFFSSRALLRVV